MTSTVVMDSDTASYVGSGSAVQIYLGAGLAFSGHAAGDTLTSIENLVGSGFGDTMIGDFGNNRVDGGGGNDFLAGDRGDDTIGGEAGNDSLFGGVGNDIISGGAGNDTLTGGAYADHMDGGDDFDIASYARSQYSVQIYLEAGTAFSGEAAGDSFASIEGLEGSVSGDTLVGSFGANWIAGGLGDDFVAGDSGDDTVLGQDGDDQVFGGWGHDHIEGGAGNDTLTGGVNADVFVFRKEGAAALAQDTITDFIAGSDMLDFSAVDVSDILPGQQKLVLSNALDGTPGQLAQTLQAGSVSLSIDYTGNGIADHTILLENVNALLAVSDFIL